MQIKADTADQYVEQLPEDRKEPINKLSKVILKNLPNGFVETTCYGMIGYVIPLSIYPKGYHVGPNMPLMLITLASQKNFIALYHMGIYADKKLMEWFTGEYPKHCKSKLDMGKSCIRFKKIEDIPYDLVGELASKMSPEKWIEKYEFYLKHR